MNTLHVPLICILIPHSCSRPAFSSCIFVLCPRLHPHLLPLSPTLILFSLVSPPHSPSSNTAQTRHHPPNHTLHLITLSLDLPDQDRPPGPEYPPRGDTSQVIPTTFLYRCRHLHSFKIAHGQSPMTVTLRGRLQNTLCGPHQSLCTCLNPIDRQLSQHCRFC